MPDMNEYPSPDKITWPDEPGRRTPEELATFVQDLLDRKIWTDRHGGTDSFMLLGLGALANASAGFIEKIGLIYEYMDKAGPMAMNGRPMFFSMNIMHVDDATKALEAYEKEKAARAERKDAIEQSLAEKPDRAG